MQHLAEYCIDFNFLNVPLPLVISRGLEKQHFMRYLWLCSSIFAKYKGDFTYADKHVAPECTLYVHSMEAMNTSASDEKTDHSDQQVNLTKPVHFDMMCAKGGAFQGWTPKLFCCRKWFKGSQKL